MQRAQILFILKFFSLFIILSWFLNLQPVQDLFVNLFITISKGILIIIGNTTHEIINNQITVNSHPLLMARECTGTPMYALFAAFALAYKATWDKKLKGTAIGILILFILNIVRLGLIYIAAIYAGSLLNFLHDFLWPSTFFIFTLITAALYIRWCK